MAFILILILSVFIVKLPILNPRSHPFIAQGSNSDINWESLCSSPSVLDIATPTQIEGNTILFEPNLEITSLNPCASSFCLRENAHDLDPEAKSFQMKNILTSKSTDALFEENNEDDPKSILKLLKAKNVDLPVIAHLNINFLAPKFDDLKSIVKDTVDLLMVSETKIDNTFSTEQFWIEGYSRPIRLDRNCHGGGLMIFVRDDLPCHELASHKLPIDIECIFLEMTIRKSKWLIIGGYNPHIQILEICWPGTR